MIPMRAVPDFASDLPFSKSTLGLHGSGVLFSLARLSENDQVSHEQV
jgi:hypothetical protein